MIVAGMQGQTVEAPVNKGCVWRGFSSVEKSTDSNDHEEAFQAESSREYCEIPLVGTFYAAPSEDADPFVKIGDKVKKRTGSCHCGSNEADE